MKCIINNMDEKAPEAPSEEELDRIYREGYLRIPEDPDAGKAQAAMLAERLADDPW